MERVAINAVDGVLLASASGELYDELLDRLTVDASDRAVAPHVRGMVLDLGAVQIIDSYSLMRLTQLSRTLAALGVDLVVVGIRAAVASALVELNVDTTRLQTARSVESAMRVVAP